MIDPRFFTKTGPFTLGHLADRLGGTLSDGAPREMTVTDLAALEDAGPSEIALFSDNRYRAGFALTKAGIVLTRPNLPREARPDTPHLLEVTDPRQAFTELAWLFYPNIEEALGLTDERAQATIAEGCRIADSARIGKGATIGARTVIAANVVIGAGVVIGADCTIGANSSVSFSILGDRVQIYAGAVVGSQGFGFVPGPKGLRRVPQLGRVVMGNDVEFGSNSTIDRGALGDTTIGDGSVIDNLVQIGHNSRIGRSCILCGQSGVAGSVTIEDGAVVGGGCGIADHVTIGRGAKLAGGSGVTGDIAPGETYAGYPAIPVRSWRRQAGLLNRLLDESRKKPG